MPSLGSCGVCGGVLAAVNGGIGCGDCGAPARNHPLMAQVNAHRFMEAEQKLKEIDIQQASLNEQKELWVKIREESKPTDGVMPVAARKPPQAPSMANMLPAGATLVEAAKVQAAGVFDKVGTAPLVGAGATAVSATLPQTQNAFCDTDGSPLMAKAKNGAGQAILDKNKRR